MVRLSLNELFVKFGQGGPVLHGSQVKGLWSIVSRRETKVWSRSYVEDIHVAQYD
jgi:hypothetical protein